MDYKFWDDPADAIRTREGSLLPLWAFNKENKKRKNVTAICWSPLYLDMFAVGYGSYNFQKQAGGIIEVSARASKGCARTDERPLRSISAVGCCHEAFANPAALLAA